MPAQPLQYSATTAPVDSSPSAGLESNVFFTPIIFPDAQGAAPATIQPTEQFFDPSEFSSLPRVSSRFEANELAANPFFTAEDFSKLTF
jgi:hypothetical protein